MAQVQPRRPFPESIIVAALARRSPRSCTAHPGRESTCMACPVALINENVV